MKKKFEEKLQLNKQFQGGTQVQRLSHSMHQYKESIRNSQIKIKADPNKWLATGQLVHDKPLVPANFKISKREDLKAEAEENAYTSQIQAGALSFSKAPINCIIMNPRTCENQVLIG